MQSMRKSQQEFLGFLAGVVAVTLILGTAGCGRPDAPPPETDAAPRGSTPPSPQAPPLVEVPAPELPDDAPVLADAHPMLAGGVLTHARLADLPAGVVLQARGLAVTQDDLQGEISQLPPEAREQMRKNAFFVLEQKVTGDLLLARARQATGAGGLDEERLLRTYIDGIAQSVSVTDAEIEAFVEENRALVGDAPLDQLRPRVRQHLLQDKRQEAVESHLRDFGKDEPIALSRDWVAAQAALALDNPLDRARGSGKATFASFGADTCIPCQMMKPVREAMQEKYGDEVNVVYVHVNKDHMLASRYGVRGIPHLIFFDAAGEQVYEHSGVMTQEQVEAQLGKLGAGGA